MKFTIHPGNLTIADIRTLLDESTALELAPDCLDAIHQSEAVITHAMKNEQTVYGINTGFGMLATTRIDVADLENLQRKIVLSHATGVGELLSDQTVRLILALKINSLARGYSGVKLRTIEALIKLFNAKVYPCIPGKGSVGASGDLAPLAHMSALLLGVGEARHEGKMLSASDALTKASLQPLKLAPKEGLALLNGTQTSTALALQGLIAAEDIFVAAITAGAMSVDAACGTDKAFDARIQAVRGHASQIQVAKILRDLLHDSKIKASHHDCGKVQDPYSL